MTLRTNVKLPAPNGVAVSTTATLRCPIGRTYHSISLVTNSVAVADDISEIRVLANGEVIHQYSGAQLDAMNQYKGLEAAGNPAIIVIPFDRVGLLTRRGQEFSAMRTISSSQRPSAGNGVPPQVQTLDVEIDITADMAAPSIVAYAEQSGGDWYGRPRADGQGINGLMRKVRRFIVSSASDGFEYVDLPRGDVYDMIFTYKAADDITQLQILRENVELFNRTNALNERYQENGIRVPQDDYFVYDPTEKGYGDEGLVTQGVSDLRLRYFMSTAASITILAESLGALSL